MRASFSVTVVVLSTVGTIILIRSDQEKSDGKGIQQAILPIAICECKCAQAASVVVVQHRHI